MYDYDNHAPVKCRSCGESASFPTKIGYRCDACGYILSWSFFKMWKLKCGCDRCLADLQQEFWKKTPPHELGEDYQDFQI